MSLPKDPKERRRVTARLLQHRYCNNAVRPSVIAEHGDEVECSSIERQQVTRFEPDYDSSATRLVTIPWKSQDVRSQTSYGVISKLNQPHGSMRSSTRPCDSQNRLNGSNHGPPQFHRDEVEKYFESKQPDYQLRDPTRGRLSLANGARITDSSLDIDGVSSFIKLNNSTLADAYESSPVDRKNRRESLHELGFGRLSSYRKFNVLGSGTYSVVYKGASLLAGQYVALKEIHLERDEGVPFTAIREISLLKQLKHNNIVTLHDIIHTRKTLILVFEFVDKDLSHYMVDCDHKISLNDVKLFLFQLLRALKYCHDRKVLHRDIKPQNILINQFGELKLADFGLARAKTFPTKTYTDEVVTLWYRPPDILLGNVDYGTDIDMWGVGCIFFEMAAGFTLFLATDPKKQIASIFEIIGTPKPFDWPSIKSDLNTSSIDIPQYPGRDLASVTPRLDETGIDLLSRFLVCNPKLRIRSGDAMHHKYFGSLPPDVHNLEDSKSIFSIANIAISARLDRSKLDIANNVSV